jgi:hypothetical protein|tara:strand:+ start:212 stop:379 length:168 start_codon:yes stop_codon:yes gene_type:complete
MPTLTKTQARRRINEAINKINRVYMDYQAHGLGGITVAELTVLSKTLTKILKRLN